MKKTFFLLLLFFSIQFSFAQSYQIKPEYSDCVSALKINDTVIHFTESPKGNGKVVEFKSTDYSSPYFFPSEDNSLWITFAVPLNCNLSLDIIPDTLSDDYDFLLFKYTGNETDFCEKITNKTLKPLRSIISANNRKIACKTGLSLTETKTNIPPGYGKSYGNAIKAKKGDVYYLAINNVWEPNYTDPNYAKGGFVLQLHYSEIMNASVKIIDKKSGLPVLSNIDIICNKNADTLNPLMHPKNVTEYAFLKKANTTYIFNVSAKGYLGSNIELNSNSNTDTTFTIMLDKIESGAKMNIENIYFVGNKATILPTSQPALEMLYLTMKENPDLNIEIQGHVNCPTNNCLESQESLQNLSDKRAEAVQEYPVNKGILKNRSTTKGYSNKKMIYPTATTEDKMKKNRRVEILVK